MCDFCLQISKNIVLQWGELPTSVAYIGTGQIMGWGNKVRYSFILFSSFLILFVLLKITYLAPCLVFS
jgi:hypothetical protein